MSTIAQTTSEITFISDGVLTPVTRFRVTPILQRLRSSGWQGNSIYGYGVRDQAIKTRVVKKAYRIACRLKRAWQTAMLNTDGPVMLQRLAIPSWSGPECRLARRNQKTVFDFDDAIFMNHQHAPDPKRKKALSNIFHAVRHIVTGNSWLAEHVDADTPVSIIPTCLDTQKYCPTDATPETEQPVRVGWMGTSSNYPFLQQLVGDWKRLKSKFGSKISMTICSDEPPPQSLGELDAEFVKWSPANEVATLQSFDIGLMPLAMDDWCRGKCSFKLIQYMAVGKPVVCTPVGMNLDVVQESENGLFAERDWAEPLEALIESYELRLKMGAVARQIAEERYDLSVALEAYRQIFLGLL